MARLLLENLKATEHNFFFDKCFTVSPPPLSAGGQLSIPNFEKGGSEKKEVPTMGICLVGLTMFLVKKRLLKIKYGFEGSISNVDLGVL